MAVALLTMRARGFGPRRCACSRVPSSSNAAPSAICGEVPTVCRCSMAGNLERQASSSGRCAKAGGNCAKPCAVISGRIELVTLEAVETHYALPSNTPDSHAAAAFVCVSTA